MPPPDRARRIEEAFANLGHELLRPVRDELGEEFSYEELRLVRVGIHRQQELRAKNQGTWKSGGASGTETAESLQPQGLGQLAAVELGVA